MSNVDEIEEKMELGALIRKKAWKVAKQVETDASYKAIDYSIEELRNAINAVVRYSKRSLGKPPKRSSR
jgi:hypothetical protein